MGYTTEFYGVFKLDKKLKKEHAAYLRQFSDTRRMKRDETLASALSDPIRLAAKLPVGREGAFYVATDAFDEKSVVDGNKSPEGQPGLWCHWIPTDDNKGIVWDGGEKFYDYVEWISYLIENFLAPWGYVVNGEMEWVGEDKGDIGKIVIIDNMVEEHMGRYVYD